MIKNLIINSLKISKSSYIRLYITNSNSKPGSFNNNNKNNNNNNNNTNYNNKNNNYNNNNYNNNNTSNNKDDNNRFRNETNLTNFNNNRNSNSNSKWYKNNNNNSNNYGSPYDFDEDYSNVTLKEELDKLNNSSNDSIVIENIEYKEKENIFKKYEDKPYFEKVEIPKNTLSMTFKYSKSSGPGGQNVNKVNTKCEVRIDLETANWIPSWIKENIRNNFNRLVTKDNYLIIVSTKHRTQELNKKEAMDKLRHVINTCSFRPKVRIATEVPQYAKEERLAEKKHRHDIKKDRKKKQIHEYFNDRY